MIFKVDYICTDMCGNWWTEDPPDYVAATDIVTLWRQLHRPRVTAYTIDGDRVARSRTPAGQGYGTWEDNPDFNWLVDRHDAEAFEALGRHRIRVETINPKSPEEIEV